MEEIEKKVYELIGKMSKKELCIKLNIVHNTLEARLKKGGWLKTEIEVIEELIKTKNT